MLLSENNQWRGGVMQPDPNHSYCYHPEVTAFPKVYNSNFPKLTSVYLLKTDTSYFLSIYSNINVMKYLGNKSLTLTPSEKVQ